MSMCIKYGACGAFLLFISLSLGQMSPAQAQCRLCAEPQEGSVKSAGLAKADEIPLNIEITTSLDFSRLAMLSHAGGEVVIDPQTGHRRISGAVMDLGGFSLNGKALITGEPGRAIRVYLPENVVLTAANGSSATVEKLETDLPASVQLDQTGKREFSFGGRLQVTGHAGGQYRGRIAITADYE